jgi:serine/threonine-protein kinase
MALRRAPNDPEILAGAAAVERALGRWDDALTHVQQARRLDPRSWRIANGLQVTLLWMRRYSEALTASEAALALAPGELSISQDKAMIYLAQGDLAGARAVIRDISPAVPPPALAAFFGTYWDMYWVLDEAQQQLLLRLTPAAFDNDRVVWASVLMQTAWLRGDTVTARAYADSCLGLVEQQLQQTPDPNRHIIHGLALAYLGRHEQAIAEGERGVALVPLTRDATNGPYIQHQLARIYLLAGQPEKALDQLEPLLWVPYYLSPGWLRIDPTFAELKGNPRFERLLAGGTEAR